MEKSLLPPFADQQDEIDKNDNKYSTDKDEVGFQKIYDRRILHGGCASAQLGR